MSLAAGEAGSLWHALSLVPDNRRAEGKRYPLASLLLIAVAAFLSGRRDQLGIVRWGRRLTREALASIGISRARVPAPSVWCELFRGWMSALLSVCWAIGSVVSRPRATLRLTVSDFAAVPQRSPLAFICWRRSVPRCKA